MLKLERTKKNRTVSVGVRDKDSLFTRPFALAFAIAFGIHLTLVLLFHVSPFKIGMSETVFPPTRLEADLPLKESAIAHLEPAVQTIKGLPPYPMSAPSIPAHPDYLNIRPVEYNKAERSTTTSFENIELAIYRPQFIPAAPSEKKPLEIVISGILSQHPLTSDGLNQKALPKITHNENERAIYTVVVEGKTGKIFWFEPKQRIKDSTIDAFAEAILREMRFAVAPNALAMSGEIELHFNFEAK